MTAPRPQHHAQGTPRLVRLRRPYTIIELAGLALGAALAAACCYVGFLIGVAAFWLAPFVTPCGGLCHAHSAMPVSWCCSRPAVNIFIKTKTNSRSME